MKVRSFRESEPSKVSGSRSLGLDGIPVFTISPIAFTNFCTSERGSGVSRLICTGVCCGVDMSTGVGGCVADQVAGVELPDGYRRVKVSSSPACCEFCVVWGIKQVIGRDVRIYCYE